VPSAVSLSRGSRCRRILSDNGPSYRSGVTGEKACRRLWISAHPHQAYTPQTNGKADGFIKTILAEWAT